MGSKIGKGITENTCDFAAQEDKAHQVSSQVLIVLYKKRNRDGIVPHTSICDLKRVFSLQRVFAFWSETTKRL